MLGLRVKGKSKHLRAVELLIYYNFFFQRVICPASLMILPFFRHIYSHVIILFNPPRFVIERYLSRLLVISFYYSFNEKLAGFAAVVNAPNNKAFPKRILKFGHVFFSFTDFSLRAEIILMVVIIIQISFTNKWASLYYYLYIKRGFLPVEKLKINFSWDTSSEFSRKFQLKFKLVRLGQDNSDIFYSCF